MSRETRKDGLWPSLHLRRTAERNPRLWTARGHPSLFSSRHRFRHSTFIKQKLPLVQPWLHRITANVAHAVRKVIGITNQAVKVTPLPQLAGSIEVIVDLLCAEPFPTMQQLFQCPLWMRHHQHMHMIGHHNPRDLAASLAVKMSQRISHNLGAVRLTENAFAMARIQPALHLLRKAFMVLHLLLGRVRRRIPFQPRSTLRFPLVTKLLWHGVRETIGNEVSRACLLPVRQPMECLLNLRVRIEKLHTRKDDLRPSFVQPQPL